MSDDITQQDAAAQDMSPEERLTQLQAQCEEYLAGWKRAQADYANILKERDRDRADYVKFANTSLLQSLLPAIEHFSTAIRFIPDATTLPSEVKKPWESWLVGLKAVHSLWEQAAQGAGLERISTEGTFNPAEHEAVGREVSDTVASEGIVRVLQEGWKLHGRVLRPAQVIVAASAEGDAPSESS